MRTLLRKNTLLFARETVRYQTQEQFQKDRIERYDRGWRMESKSVNMVTYKRFRFITK